MGNLRVLLTQLVLPIGGHEGLRSLGAAHLPHIPLASVVSVLERVKSERLRRRVLLAELLLNFHLVVFLERPLPIQDEGLLLLFLLNQMLPQRLLVPLLFELFLFHLLTFLLNFFHPVIEVHFELSPFLLDHF